MKIHYLQHVPYEGLGCIQQWITSKKHELLSTKFFQNDSLPKPDDLDMLIIMGGPMSVNDESDYAWLKDEKKFIKQCIEKNKIVLGICLGAQLIADVLGSQIYKNEYKEIGWFPIRSTERTKKSDLFSFLPDELTVFHWHGETFDIPKGAAHLAESEGCKNQAFVLNGKVVGLQFHFEVTEDSLKEMVKNGKSELIKNKFVHSETEILREKSYIRKNNEIMFKLLEQITTKT
jgi:GMP synthase-like glutamine amidotransferase